MHIEVKCLHFSAASQYRKSIDDTEHNKSASLLYASISRLMSGPLGMVMKWRAWPSHSLRRRALLTRHVEGRPSQLWKMSKHVIMSLSNYLSDTTAQSLLEILDSNLTRAQRDNDLIYHQDVPSVSSLPVIQPASMVSSIVPPGLLEPRKTLGNNNLIFGELIGLGAQTAIGRRQIPIVFPPV